jgi:hypothetical protein
MRKLYDFSSVESFLREKNKRENCTFKTLTADQREINHMKR